MNWLRHEYLLHSMICTLRVHELRLRRMNMKGAQA